MKIKVNAKIGTHSATIIVLWTDYKLEIGTKILAMPIRTYDSLHSSYRRLKSCNYWESFIITDINPILFISKL